MAVENLNLESFSTNNNLLTPNNALGSAAGTWTTNVDNSAWDAIGEFPTPTGNSANGTHTFTARVRKDAGSNNPDFQMVVQDAAGNTLADSGAVAITSTAGQDVVVNVAGSVLEGGVGGLAGVRVSLVGSQTGGSPSSRSVPQLDYVLWSGDFTLSLSAPPVANAGSPQSVKHGDGTVNLDGTGSTDDVAITAYSWVQIAGTSTVTLTGATTATPSFNCDTLTPDTYTFRLTVTDGDSQTDQATVNVTVSLSDPPSPDAGTSQTVEPSVGGGSSTSVTVSGVTMETEAQRSSNNFAVPAGAQSGDVAIIAVHMWDSTGVTITPPAGAQLILSKTDVTLNFTGADLLTRIYAYRLDQETGLNFTWSDVAWQSGALVTLNGVDPAVTDFTTLDVQIEVSPTESTSLPDMFSGQLLPANSAYLYILNDEDDDQSNTLTASGWTIEGDVDRTIVASLEGVTGCAIFGFTQTQPRQVHTSLIGLPAAEGGGTPTVVTLDGSNSTDDVGIVSYLWEQTGGTNTVTLTGADTAVATFNAPTEEDVLSFSLTVTDADGQEEQDTTTVIVQFSQTGPSISVWNGSTEVPASITVFNGASEASATIELAP